MNDQTPLPEIIREISLDTLLRIDVALEGNWSATVVTVWSRDRGSIGCEDVVHTHESFKPSLELYFDGSWLGLHCLTRIGGKNVFDESFATRVIAYVEEVLNN